MSTATARPIVHGLFDPATSSIQYVLACPRSGACAIIDPVLDFDPASGALATHNAEALLGLIAREGLQLRWILDTHPHADHFSAAAWLHARTGAPTATGAEVVAVQRLWKDIYNLPDFPADGRQWQRLFADGEHFAIGDLDVRIMHSPGHTLASVTYVAGDAAFVHDTLFMPASGTARCDFPGGCARRLWRSIGAILALPDETRLFTGHDYPQPGAAAAWESTVGEHKRSNPHVAGQDEASFVALREARDRTLPMPRLILAALQVNIAGGRLPPPESNGRSYLKIPLATLDGAAWPQHG
ncbi:glyoxylase-like metal-dependent hydrolase (beta-lactamase superfamily II) [Endobacter medicaginis]|uniref:Glyoxylase-like metal-dependent hydrolase (Beta-lactamase superfamily II) n=1 Tax=Endobacter medicaginis TaxID=1181271 RepID=A0A850NNH5_9PROT|nr:MBL fold metallo-hydrolase [Endobacter medicaginis]MBB3173867.1 glyoxylase-like metal-dependent hydrolase (beta-lactamase superfamily II) [Endobacter medicaginis]MCX5476149.1 MBL fold metallo-hydrolase [Endobacter medicaginis]NVN31123.1 MBL fold metallo-hydrolase [Endobacter medicaginis]